MNKPSAKNSAMRRWLIILVVVTLINFFLGNILGSLFTGDTGGEMLWRVWFTLLVLSLVATFVLGLIHLRKYRERAFALTAVIISGFFMLILLLEIFGVIAT